MSEKKTKIQELEIEAIKSLVRIFQQHHIKYYLRGGSVMGAVKFQGFIPWDDDMDIAIPRYDYNRLVDIFSANINWSDKFIFASYKTNDNLHSYFPRIIIKKSYCKKNNIIQNHTLGTTIIDILPLDGGPTGKIAKKIYFIHVKVLRALASQWTLQDSETINMKTPFRNFVAQALFKTKIYKLYSQNDIYRKLDNLYQKNNLFDSKNWGTVTGSLYQKELMPRSIWGEGKTLQFENFELRVPSEYDKYLKRLYGENYLIQLPKENKRKSHLIRRK